MSMPPDQDIARAQAMGRLAARARQSVEDCPYAREERVLRITWGLAFVRAGGLDSTVYRRLRKVRRGVRKAWVGAEG